MLPDSEKALSALKAGDVATACALFDQAIDTETDPPCLLQAAPLSKVSQPPPAPPNFALHGASAKATKRFD